MATSQRKLLPISYFPTKSKPPVTYPYGFYAQFYPKSQTSTPIISVYTPYHFNEHYMHQSILSRDNYRSCSYEEKICHVSLRSWCCPDKKGCGTYYDDCLKISDATLESLLVVAGCIFLVCFGPLFCMFCSCTVPKYFSGYNNPAINNSSNVEPLQTSAQSVGRPVYSQLRSQNIGNIRPRQLAISASIRNASLANSTGSTEQQLSRNGNSNLRRTGITSVTQPTSSLLPAYDDVLRQNSATITMEEQFLLPPSYDDFMRRNNERE